MQWDVSTPERRPDTSRNKEITTVERGLLVADMLAAAASGVRGARAKVYRAWRCTKQGALNILARYQQQTAAGNTADLSRGKRSGRPSALTPDVREKLLAAKEVKRRRSYRRWAEAATKPRATLHRWAKLMGVTKQQQWVKPSLSEAQKLARLRWVVDMIEDVDDDHPNFKSLENRFYADEKWFYLFLECKGYLVAPGEEVPAARAVRHKSHIPKAMFICLVGHPCANFNFTGLVAIHTCTEVVQAQRGSKNFDKGADKEVDVPVTAEYYREWMRRYLLPSLIQGARERAGGCAGARKEKFVLQHDGAKVHTGKGNTAHWPELLRELAPDLAIEVVVQPPQSPDLNVLDMGFFNSLQTLADEADKDTLAELLEEVEDCFWSYDPTTLEKVYNTQYDVFNGILSDFGGNGYKLQDVRGYKRDAQGLIKPRQSVNVLALRKVLEKYPQLL
jgi:hypothetical protein